MAAQGTNGEPNGVVNVHANGTVNGHSSYSIPTEAGRVFQSAILEDSRIAEDLPTELQDAASKIHFTGSPDPSIPVNWRFAEAVSSLKALEASLTSVLLKRKYGVDYPQVTIDTDHATLFIMSATAWTIDPGEGGLNISGEGARDPGNKQLEKLFPDREIHRSKATLHRRLATNIYKCSDGCYFNLHGSMNPDPTLDSVGLPHESDPESLEAGVDIFQSSISKISSEELQHRTTDIYRQAGSICYSVDDFNASEHGQANKHVGLWEIFNHPSSQPAGWWPSISSTSAARPLAGLKVVDLTRVIAAPAVTRGLAELGASVMRVTSPNLPDVSGLHPDLQWGKWNCHLDLKNASDREKLRALILDADVVVQGYRPGVLDKYGFGQQAIIDMCSGRERGIISVRENCYGWHGPWKDRSGWQQISDAVVGTSLGFGQAMGLADEPVMPIFPHSDYCTGISGICAILIALLRRGEKGGNYAVDLALNMYSTWLVNSVGEYPKAVFDKVWMEHDRKVWRHWESNAVSSAATLKKLRENNGGKRLFKDDFFEMRSSPAILGERKFRHIRSIPQWEDGVVEPGFRIGARGNGIDAAKWPQDLGVEVVT